MSEQNILNPTQTSLLSPDWGYAEGLPETRAIFQPKSGRIYSRREMGRGRIYNLPWNNRDLNTKHLLQQWAQQYENDFFTLADWERGRYFSGRFDGPLTFTPSGNQRYNIRGQFIEIPGLPMFAYPANWSRDAFFLTIRNGFGEDLVKLLTAANWTFDGTGSPTLNPFSGNAYRSQNTNETAEWIYFGYDCQIWSPKFTTYGIAEFTITRIRDGVAVAGPTNVDLYAATFQNSAPVFTTTNLGLDFYRVKIRVTGTKNALSTGFICWADAVQVMQ